MGDKYPMTVKYMHAEDSLIGTKDEMLSKIAEGIGYTLKEFAEHFLIEEYSPHVIEQHQFVDSREISVQFEQKFRIRLKTYEEKELERANRAKAMVNNQSVQAPHQ